MANMRSAIVDGIKNNRKSETFDISVKALRLFEENQRFDYGFNPAFQNQIMEIIREKYITGDFTQEEIDLIKENLIDPSLVEDHKNTDYFGSMHWLVNSLRNSGQADPIRGYWDSVNNTFTVTDGNRRTVALIVANYVFNAGIVYATVLHEPVKPGTSGFLSNYLARQMTSNQGTKPLTPLEQAYVIKRLRELGTASEEDLIALVGSKARLIQRIALLDLPEEMTVLVKEGSVTPTVAIQLQKEAEKEETPIEEVIEAVKDASIEVQEARKNGKSKATKASKTQIQSALRQRKNKTSTASVAKLPDSIEVKASNGKTIESIKSQLGNVNSMVTQNMLDAVHSSDLITIQKKLQEVFDLINKANN